MGECRAAGMGGTLRDGDLLTCSQAPAPGNTCHISGSALESLAGVPAKHARHHALDSRTWAASIMRCAGASGAGEPCASRNPGSSL